MRKILIIEDDPLIARVYGTKYAAAGFETSIAIDGEMGLELVNTFKPDLVHLDLLVPKVNGVEVVRRIRSQPELEFLPIVVLSNTYQNRLAKAVMEAGATQLVSKATCTPKMMIEIVEKLRSQMRPTPTLDAAIASDTPIAPDTPALSVEAPSVPANPRSDADINAGKQASFQTEIRNGFLGRAPHMLAGLRDRVEPLLRAEDAASRIPELSEMRRITHSFAGHAAIAGFEDLSQMSSALVALLTELLDNPESVTDSSLRTIVDACHFLPELLARSTEAPAEASAPPLVLVVDDEVISRRLIARALACLNTATVMVDDPRIALRLVQENRFSLIFLDVGMPEMGGFELCTALRALPMNQATPVVFVTALSGFESRDRAFACGGNDLLAKPFLPMELAVKALSLLRRHSENPGKVPQFTQGSEIASVDPGTSARSQ